MAVTTNKNLQKETEQQYYERQASKLRNYKVTDMLCTFVVEQGSRFSLSEPYVSYLHPPAQDPDVRNKLTNKNKSQI